MHFALRRGTALATLAVAIVVSSSVATAAPAAAGRERGQEPRVVVQTGRFGVWNDNRPPTAVTYDQRLVPVGARVVVAAASASWGSTVILLVAGLVPDRTYGAHVHVRPCGATGAVAGPHYQHVPDPVQPSVDPAYANPRNEVWLDFTTDANGSGRAISHVDWRFRSGGANSVVIHERGTSTGPGEAGMAGARVGCLTVRL